MRSCRTGSIFAFGALGAAFVIGACRSSQTPSDIPPVTVAHPTGNVTVLSGPADHTKASETTAAPMTGSAPHPAEAEATCPITARFIEAPTKIADGFCVATHIAVVRGKLTVMNETLDKGDVLVVRHGLEGETKGNGLAVEARMNLTDCNALSRPAPEKNVIRGSATPKLEWAGGKMAAWLDSTKPEMYLGRLEGTAPVAEHVHAQSWEVLASIEANGTFTLDGKDAHLGPRQIVAVPPNTKHAWKPEQGQKLVAIQMYSPSGPEQRFLGLAAQEKDAKDAGARPTPADAGAQARP